MDLKPDPQKPPEFLLPSNSLSVLDFTQFVLPCVTTAAIEDDSNLSRWFSTLDHTSDASSIRQIPSPPLELVYTLSRNLKTHHRSILPFHLPSQLKSPVALPVWVISYWAEAYRMKDIQRKWKRSLEWVEERTKNSKSGRQLRDRVVNSLACLRWTGQIFTSSRASGEVIETLATYLSDDWLHGYHLDQMISVLKMRINSQSDLGSWSSRHILVDITFGHYLVDAFAHQATYETDRRYVLLRAIEANVVAQVTDTVSGIFWINQNHYTYYSLDFDSQQIGYGDSLCSDIPQTQSEAAGWWMGRTLAKRNPGTKPMLVNCKLPITRQRDLFSCGVLAINRIAYHCTQGVPLVEGDKGSLRQERMETFLSVIEMHSSWVSSLYVHVYKTLII